MFNIIKRSSFFPELRLPSGEAKKLKVHRVSVYLTAFRLIKGTEATCSLHIQDSVVDKIVTKSSDELT